MTNIITRNSSKRKAEEELFREKLKTVKTESLSNYNSTLLCYNDFVKIWNKREDYYHLKNSIRNRSTFTVKKLKEILRSMGEVLVGKKIDLIKRVENNYENTTKLAKSDANKTINDFKKKLLKFQDFIDDNRVNMTDALLIQECNELTKFYRDVTKYQNIMNKCLLLEELEQSNNSQQNNSVRSSSDSEDNMPPLEEQNESVENNDNRILVFDHIIRIALPPNRSNGGENNSDLQQQEVRDYARRIAEAQIRVERQRLNIRNVINRIQHFAVENNIITNDETITLERLESRSHVGLSNWLIDEENIPSDLRQLHFLMEEFNDERSYLTILTNERNNLVLESSRNVINQTEFRTANELVQQQMYPNELPEFVIPDSINDENVLQRIEQANIRVINTFNLLTQLRIRIYEYAVSNNILQPDGELNRYDLMPPGLAGMPNNRAMQIWLNQSRRGEFDDEGRLEFMLDQYYENEDTLEDFINERNQIMSDDLVLNNENVDLNN
tara:strand:+ start:371 stop:1867 length:1497 start_codon:yes stop_codon:yes gene_type:complete